ncbi:MAG: hypothetical protein MSK39_04930 [Dysosmobacter sp.]|nr:hypothetical protein [Dysosmobacter sp.]
MNVFRKIGNAIARFMYGRNGMDQLNLVLMWVVLILDVVTMLVQRNHAAVSMVLYWLSMAGWVYVLFRMFSKNLSKRRGENQKFVNWVWRMKSSRAGAKERHADKDHKYFTCKNCKTICRVPVGKGKIIITCPKCGAQIHAKT